MPHIDPTGEQLKAFATLEDDGSAIVMLNLLRYRTKAAYTAEQAQAPCSGRDAFKRYAKLSIACIESIGGKVMYMGAALATAIGPADEQWDDIFLVRYPSRRAFFDMLASSDYQTIAFHRTAALQDSRLIASRGKFFAS